MTPEQKGGELIEKFKEKMFMICDSPNVAHRMAVRCAIIEALDFLDLHTHLVATYSNDFIPAKSFWQSVLTYLKTKPD